MSANDAPKVLHVIRQLNASGMVFGVLGLAERCREHGLQTAVLARRGLLDEECSRRGIPVLPVDADLSRPVVVQWVAWHRAVSLAREFDPDVLHLHGSELDGAAARLSRALRRPYVLTFDGFQRRRKRLRISHPGCRRVIAPSEGLREDLVNLAGLPKERIEVIPPGIRISDYERYGGLRVEGAAPLVGTLLRLLPSKGLDQFLRAAQIVFGEIRDAQFAIVGEGPHKRALWRLAGELGIRRQVTFCGAVSDHRAVLSAFDVFVAPMMEETSQFATLESMACARPVVATSVGSTYQIVQDGVTGRLVQRGDPQALAAAILELLKDRNLAARLGRQAQRFVTERYEIHQTADRVIDSYGLPQVAAADRDGV